MAKVLIIHHLEPEWSEAYMRVGGITFEKLCKKTAKHIKKSDYSRVILTQFNPIGLHESYPYEPLIGKVDEVHEYGYGWELESFDFTETDSATASENLAKGEVVHDRYGQGLAKGGYHSQVVLVDDWMFELAGHEVYLCGAFDGECIEDMEIALSAAGVSFNRISKLII